MDTEVIVLKEKVSNLEQRLAVIEKMLDTRWEDISPNELAVLNKRWESGECAS
jgi:hypothetical protein